MRVGIVVILAFAIGIVMATSRNRNYSHFGKYQARSRVVRGFIPRQTGIAVGFGKRQSNIVNVPKVDRHEQILSTLLRFFPQGISIEWLLQQMKTNPAFATKLTQVLIDGHADFMSMMDRSNPDRITWLL
ncbi:allatotropin [Xylocopa sonorina]|uniref:allatotropin n=1 Tax=Xylocopa sonorina TaxID=1818115 RepID=UPI00403ADB09